MNNRRLACILLPGFPLELVCKIRPDLRSSPLALTDQLGETALLTAVNDRAAAFGVTTGMTVAQANSLCPGLKTGPRDHDREQRTLGRIRKILADLSPDIETDHAAAFLEASRLKKIYRDESHLARTILKLLRPLDYPVTIGFAINKFVAQLAASRAPVNRWLIVPTGSESGWLKQLRIDRLILSEGTGDTLTDLGIATVGQAAALPVNEVIGRFGREGAGLARRARGEDPEFFLPARPTDNYRATVTLDYPVRDTGRICKHIERLLDSLLRRLRHYGRAGGEIHVTLRLDNHTDTVFKAAVEKPTATPVPFIRQVTSHLERLKLKASATDITVRIPHTATLILEQTAFDPHRATSAIDDHTVKTLDRTLNGHQLCTVHLHRDHLPERNFHLKALTPATSKKKRPEKPLEKHQPYSLRRIAGLRLLQPPRPARLGSLKGPDGHDRRVLYDESGAHPVTDRQGPWKISGDWWGPTFNRLYYELHTDDNRSYLVFFDRDRAEWFLQGVYD